MEHCSNLLSARRVLRCLFQTMFPGNQLDPFSHSQLLSSWEGEQTWELIKPSLSCEYLRTSMIWIMLMNWWSGCGPLGLLIMAVARAYGVKKIIAFDVEQSRVDFAVKYGADIGVLSPMNKSGVKPMEFASTFVSEMMKKHDLGSGVDLTIEASGAEACVQMGVHITKPGGMCKCSNSLPQVRYWQKE